MNDEEISEKNFHLEKNAEVKNLLIEISGGIEVIGSTLKKLSSGLEGDKIFSLNTLAHIIAPGFLGSICALLISIYGFDVVDSRRQSFLDSVAEGVAYVFVATTVAGAVTAYTVGIPSSSEKRTKTWLTCMALSITLPSSLTYLNSSAVQLQFMKDESSKLARQLFAVQTIVNDLSYEMPQINLSLNTTEVLLKSNQVSDSIKEESLQSTISLIDSNPDLLDNPDIASRYFNLFRSNLNFGVLLAYDEWLLYDKLFQEARIVSGRSGHEELFSRQQLSDQVDRMFMRESYFLLNQRERDLFTLVVKDRAAAAAGR